MQNAEFKIDSKATELNLDYNVIDDAGAAALAAVLYKTSLTSLDLEENNIGAAGAEAILEIARNNPCFVTEIKG